MSACVNHSFFGVSLSGKCYMMPPDAPEGRSFWHEFIGLPILYRNFPLLTKLKEKEEYATREAVVGTGPSFLLSARI